MMKTCSRWGRVPLGLGALAITAIVMAASFQMAGAQDVPAEKNLLTGGPGIPKSSDLVVLPPIKVDYRDDETTRSLEEGKLIAEGKPVIIDHRGSVAGTVTGEFCRLSIECNDCNPCTLDSCNDSVCVGGDRNGAACNSDADCEGTCSGGVANGSLCRNDLDCCGDEGTPNGTCVFNPCTALTTGGELGTGGNQCINWTIPVGRFEAGSECDDGLDCNGKETCNAGACVAGDPLTSLAPRCNGGVNDGLPCDPGGVPEDECPLIGPGAAPCEATPVACGDQELVCSESGNTCIAACTTDADCDIDGLACTNDICPNPKTCVGGGDDGTPCSVNADCTSNVCGGAGDGLCAVGPNPCGPGGTCAEPAVPGGNPVCQPGRCCDAGNECTQDTYANCQGVGDTWLGTANACEQLDSGNFNSCPVYGSGIAPQGDFTVMVDNVASFAACPGGLSGLGDDFLIAGAAPGDFVDVELVRMVVSVETAARFAIEFWDANGIFIEDAFFPLGTNLGATGPVILTADFDPPLTVPADAFLAISIATNFGPFGNVGWMATSGVDIGTNNPTKMLINGVVENSDYLGVCSGGLRDGGWCDRGNGDSDCGAGGTCDDVDDTLAFEIVATLSGPPQGACCFSETGVCGLALPWECEAAGNFFQGVGTFCQACENNLFTACETNADCPACVGGSTPGEACVDNGDCLGGGTCTGTSTCVDTPPACQFNACCAGDGTCTPVQGGLCLGGTNGGLGCLSDDQCPGGTCEPQCPAGSPQGFGTTCDPNCCTQPARVAPGGDNCFDAPVTAINVPNVGDPAVTVTLTGSNVGATFDDWNTAVCVGGANDGQPCTFGDDVFCGDGDCTRTCGSGIFDPNGATADPAWWEAFSIDDCADVRVDMCCTDPVLQPQWAFLAAGCPCQIFIGNQGVAPPVGIGEDTAGSARGGPFCNEDNLWQTYAILGPGTYHVPVYSAPNGTFASPPGGTYQMHITVGACPVAACCTNVCSGGTRDGEACNADGMPACPGAGAECVGGFCAGGAYDGLPCDGLTGVVDQCPGGACGGADCVETNELICNTAGGRFLAGRSYPDNLCVGGSNAGADCDPLVATDCPGGTCNENLDIVSCAASPCTNGSCCQGPGECADTLPGGQPMTLAECTTQQGTFVGGARCLFEPSPCPVCTALSADNCQRDNAGFISWADRTLPAEYGRKVADDFIARSSAIEQFCWWPGFLGVNPVTGGTNECSDPNDTPPPPPDNWLIQFFSDNNGLPGTLIHTVELSDDTTPVTAKAWRGGNSRVWSYSQVFDPPLTGFVIGERYWVEFSGAGNDECNILMLQSEDGNGYFLQEDNQFGDDVWTLGDVSSSQNDIAFCIGGPATPSIDFAEPLTGACCGCDGVCMDDVSRDDCLGYTCLRDGTGAAESCESLCIPEDQAVACTVLPAQPSWLTSTFSPGQTCAEAGCENLGAGGGCPGDPGGREGEDCVFPLALPGDGDYPFNNNCSSTDGPAPFCPSCEIQADNGASGTFERDLWYTYTTVEEGLFQVDLCGDGSFDTMLAVYSDGSSVCPSVCPPPLSTLLGGVYIDDACNTTPGKPSFERFGPANVCYLIRVGGFVDATEGDNPDVDVLNAAGVGVMNVTTNTAGCPPSPTPEAEEIANAGGTIVANVKNRMLSVSVPADPGGNEKAIRVTFVDLPSPYDVWNGETLWANSNVEAVSENGGSRTHVNGFADFWVAELDCDRTVDSFADWASLGTVHIYHEGIIPGGTYEVVVMDSACSEGLPGWISEPLNLVNPRWGDTVGAFNAGVWTASDDSVDVARDVVAGLDKFSSAATAPAKSRTDLEPRILDFKINITDITVVLDAFGGALYPFPPSVGDPCP